MSQTSYSINTQPWAYPGQIADTMQASDIITAIAVAAAIPYGLLCVIDQANSAGFAEMAAKLPAAATDITNFGSVLGVSVADQARAQNPAVSAAVYPQGSAVPIAKKKRIVVYAEGAVTVGGKVYGRFQAGDNGTVIGALGGVLDTSVVGNALVPNAVWADTVAAAGFAVVELGVL